MHAPVRPVECDRLYIQNCKNGVSIQMMLMLIGYFPCLVRSTGGEIGEDESGEGVRS